MEGALVGDNTYIKQTGLGILQAKKNIALKNKKIMTIIKEVQLYCLMSLK